MSRQAAASDDAAGEERPLLSRQAAASTDDAAEEERRRIAGILLQARVEDPNPIIRLLMESHITAADLTSVDDVRAEAMLQKAGVVIGDCHKIMRILRGFHHGQIQSPRTSAAAGISALCDSLCCCCIAMPKCLCSACSRSASGSAAAVSPARPTIKYMLIVYSTTVLIVALAALSFFLPAVLFQVRSNHLRIGGRKVEPAQANFVMPHVGRSLYGGGASGGDARGWGSAAARSARHGEVMMVTANQPLPCTTRRGDWIMELALRNKLMYATLHDYKTWWSTELVSAWDLEAAWNKIPLLYILMHSESPVTQGIEWLLWMDDDAIFTDMNFTFPFDDYDAQGINLVIWGDPQRVFRANDIQGLNTGVFLLRKCEWSRQLMAEVAALATPSIRRQIGNKGRIAEQGALTWVLHSQSAKWKDRVQLERNFTMNGNWMDYAGKWVKGQKTLVAPVWGNDKIPFVVQYAGCQMCRGHSENGSWHDQGVRKCHSAFLEAYTFGDDQVLSSIGLRHLSMETHLVRANEGTELYQRHLRMTRCLPRFLVIGTQKGGTSSFHWLLKEGWHQGVQVNNGEKEIHYFSWDDNFRKGPLEYQKRFDGSGERLGECTGERVRGEVSATYLDYPKAAERAAQLLPGAKIVMLLREPVSRLVSSFNMKWQVEICGKLTWTRSDCYNGITSVRLINENSVASKQRLAALAVWNKCNVEKKRLDTECLRNDFVAKLTERIDAEVARLDGCARSNHDDIASCLGLTALEQAHLYAEMEDRNFIWRSMYVDHVQRWLKVYPPEAMLIVPSEALKEAESFKKVMGHFAGLLGLPRAGPQVNNELIDKASPASADGKVHENGRSYVGEAPADLTIRLNKIFCPKNQELAQLLLDKKMIGKVDEFPWLATALKRDVC